MTLGALSVVEAAGAASLAILGLSLLACLARLLRGPSFPDRVIALDVLGILVLGIVVVATILASTGVLLDVAIVLALVLFVGTVAVARYLEEGGPCD
jgi:multicomponent Na+:H+ antiporter subunit F